MYLSSSKTRTRNRLPACPMVLFGLFICLTGCREGKLPIVPVGGKVLFDDGRPLAGGWVAFRSLDAQPPIVARGQVNGEGEFRLTTFVPDDGAVVGRHQAIVTSPRVIARSGFKNSPPALPIDSELSSYETSGLEFTVVTDPANNHFVINVTPPKRR